MSRWLSLEKATRRAKRAAQDAAQRRSEKLRMWLTIGGLALVSTSLIVADYYWLRRQAKQRHQQRYHHNEKTNAPASAVPPHKLR